MNVSMKISFWLIFVLLTSNLIAAQNDCGFKLKNATKLYEEGLLQDIKPMLDSCMNKGFDATQKIDAYKLLIMKEIYDDNKPKADSLMERLLLHNPLYEIAGTDPTEFVHLYRSFRTSAIFSVGLVAGANISLANISVNYGVHDTEKNKGSYQPAIGFQVYGKYNRYLFENHELSLELGIAQNSISFTSEFLDFVRVVSSETQVRIELPISLTHSFERKTSRKRKIVPFFRLGFTPALLTNSYTSIVRTYTDKTRGDVTGSDIDLAKHRKKFNFWVFSAAGIKYSLGRGKLIFDLRFNYGLSNQVVADERYNNSELIFKYFYIDNDFKLHNIAFSIGYVYSFFKPKKL